MKIEACTLYDRDHFLITMSHAILYFDRAGGGFSRMLDEEGKDWIAFSPDPLAEFPASAAAGFRGIPNLVHACDDAGAGHPGHDKCASKLTGSGDGIYTESLNGNWAWQWTFSDTTAIFEMLRIPGGGKWWFLYEGTPGGKFDPAGSSIKTRPEYDFSNLPDIQNQSFRRFESIEIGHESSEISLSIRKTDGMSDNNLWWMGDGEGGVWQKSKNGMLVVGFGRSPDPDFTGPHQFELEFMASPVLSQT